MMLALEGVSSIAGMSRKQLLFVLQVRLTINKKNIPRPFYFSFIFNLKKNQSRMFVIFHLFIIKNPKENSAMLKSYNKLFFIL